MSEALTQVDKSELAGRSESTSPWSYWSSTVEGEPVDCFWEAVASG